MDKQKLKIAGIVSGIVVAGGLLYYFLINQKESLEVSKIIPIEQIIEQATKEAKQYEPEKKKNNDQSPIFTKEFTIDIFYVLSKYATLLKRSMNE